MPGKTPRGPRQRLIITSCKDQNSRRKLLILVICACAGFFNVCASQDAKDNKGDQRREKIGAEDFMPGRVRAIYVRSCASCHGPDGQGITAVAPDLYRARHRGADEWEKYLRDSADAHPVGHQAPLWLDPDEVKDMAEYLESATRRNQ
jgi:mono/diheme cytochrome c family protein